MITTGMLKRQVWMADDDDFDHIVKNSQRVPKLNAQYKNHPYTEEFTKKRSVMFVYGTYVLEGEVDASSSCLQNKTDNTLLFPKPVIQESVKPRMEKSNIKTFGENLKNSRRPTICTTEQHLQNYAPHQKTVPDKESYANIVISNKEKVCIIGDSHLKRINKRKLK